MTVDQLMFALNDMDDAYIHAYAEKKPARKKSLRIAAVAACLALVLICIPAITHFFGPSQMDDPYRQGIEYSVNSIMKQKRRKKSYCSIVSLMEGPRKNKR